MFIDGVLVDAHELQLKLSIELWQILILISRDEHLSHMMAYQRPEEAWTAKEGKLQKKENYDLMEKRNRFTIFNN